MSIDLISLWHQRARPKPTAQDANAQLGCHFEEIAELVDCLKGTSPQADAMLSRVWTSCNALAEALKAGDVQVDITNRKGALDALADQVVTATGVAVTTHMDMAEAVRRVNASNWSKFDTDGQPIFAAGTRKVTKGPNYVPPDLTGLYELQLTLEGM